jgi:hypothetical protein
MVRLGWARLASSRSFSETIAHTLTRSSGELDFLWSQSSPSERDLYEEILAAMGGIFTHGTSVTTLRHRIRSLARQLEVRLLVIHEIHSLLAGAYREQRIILNSIRFLANDLRLPLVRSGTHEAKQALMTDQQLADHFEAAELPAWENDPSFQQLLLSFESILPLRLPSEFRDPKVHQRILSLSEGVLCPYSLDWGFHPQFPKLMARFLQNIRTNTSFPGPPSTFASGRQGAPSQLQSRTQSMPAASHEEVRLLFLSNLHLRTTICSRAF